MTDKTAGLWLAITFVVSRLAYAWAGIRFDASTINSYWQYIDPVLMKTDLLRSLWNLHMQPPLHNFLVGVVVQWFPHAHAAVFHALHLVMGAVVTWSTWRLLRLLGVSDRLALMLTVLFIISPSVVLYENLLSYDYLVLMLLQLAAIALYEFVEQPSTGKALWFFSWIGVVMLIRNMFHLVYLVGLAVLLWWALPGLRRHIVPGLVPALLVNTALYAKNWFLFGVFAASTWTGMLMGVLTTAHMSPAEIEQEITAGHLPPIARVPAYNFLKEYEPYVEPAPLTGIPVLDEAVTSTGHQNFNQLTYLRVHRAYAGFLVSTLQHRPRAYVQSVMIAWFTYFLPGSDVHTLDQMRRPIETFDRIWSAVFYGQFFRAATRKDLRALKASGQGWKLPFYTGLFFAVAIVVLHSWVARRFWNYWRRPAGDEWPLAQVVTLAFIWSTMLFITAVSNFLSSFECNRYRFPLDGFYVVLIGMVLMAWRNYRRPAPVEGVSQSDGPRGSVH